VTSNDRGAGAAGPCHTESRSKAPR
jgi:hypothetical protein